MLLSIINDILDLSRIEAGKLDLQIGAGAPGRRAAAGAGPARTAAQRAGVHLYADPVDEQAAVLADPVRLRQVLSNLLSNAVKYNRAGGSVAVSVARVVQGWRIEVGDSGIGMDDAQLAQLFEPFNRPRARAQSLGPGAVASVITRRLVHAMDGQLEVHSVLGRGAASSPSCCLRRTGPRQRPRAPPPRRRRPRWPHAFWSSRTTRSTR